MCSWSASCSWVFIHLYSSSFIFINLHSSSFIFINLHSSSFIFTHLHSSSFTSSLSYSWGRQPSQWLVVAKPATLLLVQHTAFLLGAPLRSLCCRPLLQTPTRPSHQAEIQGSAHATCCSRPVRGFPLLYDIVWLRRTRCASKLLNMWGSSFFCFWPKPFIQVGSSHQGTHVSPKRLPQSTPSAPNWRRRRGLRAEAHPPPLALIPGLATPSSDLSWCLVRCRAVLWDVSELVRFFSEVDLYKM